MSKGEETRRRIFQAARAVFTTTPYRRASIRLIAEQAGVRHPLVLHYFGSKAKLFDAVTDDLEKEILQGQPRFYSGLESAPEPEKAFFYINGSIKQALRHPEPYRFMLLNAGDAQANKKGPFQISRIKNVQDIVLAIVDEHVLEGGVDGDAHGPMLVFALVAAQYAGARVFHEKVLGLSSTDYDSWVNQAVLMLFEPLFKDFSKWKALVPDKRHSVPTSRTPDSGPAKRLSRGEKARKRIIKAARKVFSTHSYDSATIRMVGSAGNFDYSLIHHLYPTKEDLFEAAAKDSYTDLLEILGDWPRDLEGLSPEEIFSRLLQRGLDYCFENRDVLGLLTRNIANYEAYAHLSGFVHMARVHSKMLSMVREISPPDANAPASKLNQWLYSLVMAGYSLAGAPEYPASLMGLKPDSREYRDRVFQILHLVFLPSLKNARFL